MQTGTLNQQNDRHHCIRYVIVLIAAALVLTGCATADSGQPGGESISYQVTFISTPAGGIGPTQAVIRLDEEFATLDGTSGCHRILGSFTLNDSAGEASFTVPGLSTNSCSDEAQEVETHLLNALAQVVSFRRLGTDLEFQDSSQQVVLRLAPIS